MAVGWNATSTSSRSSSPISSPVAGVKEIITGAVSTKIVPLFVCRLVPVNVSKLAIA